MSSVLKLRNVWHCISLLIAKGTCSMSSVLKMRNVWCCISLLIEQGTCGMNSVLKVRNVWHCIFIPARTCPKAVAERGIHDIDNKGKKREQQV